MPLLSFKDFIQQKKKPTSKGFVGPIQPVKSKAPSALRKFGYFIESLPEAGAEILRGSTRAAGSLAVSAFGKKEFQPDQSASRLEKEVFKGMFGNKPLPNLTRSGQETLQGFGANKLSNTKK